MQALAVRAAGARACRVSSRSASSLLPRRPASCPLTHHHRTSIRPSAVAREPDTRFTDPSTTTPVVYEGVYGPWTVEASDVAEVTAYRAGLAASVVAGSAAVAAATLPPLQPWAAAHPALLNGTCAAGLAGFGMSLSLLHLYVAPLKKALLGLFAAGAAGAAFMALSHPGEALPAVIAATPASVWAVGPAAAALTGLAIKEGLCYGKPECAALAALLPAAALLHLSGLAPSAAGPLADAAAVTALVWVGRKLLTQPLVEDIGDKSVFAFRALPPTEQAAVLERVKAAAAGVVDEGVGGDQS